MTLNRSKIAGSERQKPVEPLLGPADPEASATVSLYLKRATTQAAGAASPLQTRSKIREDRETSCRSAFDQIKVFAEAHNLAVAEEAPARRLIKLTGRIQDLEAAFGSTLQMFDHPSDPFRGRSGSLTAPSNVADVVEAVLGLDQRPIATPKSVRASKAKAAEARFPNAVAALYGFPKTTGQGECIAIIELGGGVSTADTAAAFAAMGLTPPSVVAIPVSGGSNQPGKDQDADGEVALDVQVAGGAAPGSTLALYFAPNTDQGFVDAITQAAHDDAQKPSVMSISWGSAESAWTGQAITAMTSAFQDAAELGVSVFAASGDGLATDGVSDGLAHVDFPASSPWVVGCGGSRLGSGHTSKTGETVWNSNGGGTGGGLSTLFPVPTYQSGLHLPPSVNPGAKPGRGVPDVASDADPDTGYHVVVDGAQEVIGGTSAAAPLWAGLFALVNQSVGKPVGQPHARLYANPAAFNDILTGDNKSGKIGYSAQKGWDACTGLGSPKGGAIAALFKD